MIEKLNEGWLLSGDVGADAPFGLINPQQTRADFVPRIDVEIVRDLLTVGASCVAPDLLFHACRRHYPGGSFRYLARVARMTSAFPESQTGRLRIARFEACSAFTHVTACMRAKSPYATLYTEGFGDFVTSITAPIATGWSDSCRMGFAPIRDPRLFHGALRNCG